MGVPISTTHAAASSVVGAGTASGRGANWKVVGEMVIAWVITIPAAATVAFIMFHLTQLPTILAFVAVCAVLIGFGAWAVYAMMHTIHASDVEAEILPEEVLAEPVSGHPHIEGHGPVD